MKFTKEQIKYMKKQINYHKRNIKFHKERIKDSEIFISVLDKCIKEEGK